MLTTSSQYDLSQKETQVGSIQSRWRPQKKKKEKKKVVVSHISSIDHVNEKHVTHISTSANELS